MTQADHTFSPSDAARDAVAAWRNVSWGGDRYAVLGPWNQLVDHFGEAEAESLVHLVLAARGSSDPSYEANSLMYYARSRNEELEESDVDQG